MEKLISVIIPCYNVQDYIDRCFQSLLRQTIGIDALELIFIDDASTDATWERLQEIEKQASSSVVIIHCDENGRQGRARNIGLQYAACPYVSFVDADDWVDSSLYEKFYNLARRYQCDLVSCRLARDYTYSVSKKPKRTGDDRLLLIDTPQKHKSFLLAGSIGYVMCGKLFKRDMILENQMFFPEGLAYEDNLWCAYPYLYAEHVYILEEELYHYFVNPSSTVLLKDQSYHSDFLTVNLMKWQEWENRNLLPEYQAELEYDFLSTCFLGYLKILFLRCSRIPYEQYLLLRKEVLARVPDYRKNPYFPSHFTEFNQVLLQLLSLEISEADLNEMAHLARKNWLSVTVFTAAHVSFQPPEDPVYIPLHVGRSQSEDLGYLGDNTGDNISDLNCYYSELTGLYWIWKNYFASDYVGLCHYRRYFTNENHQLLNKDDYLRILSGHDIMISKPYVHETSYFDNYKEAHHIEDLLAVERAIKKLYPAQLPVFREVVWGHVSYIGNLFVTSRALFSEYAHWLFSIFREASQEIHPDNYDAYHRRVYGFLSEQLLFVWVKARKLAYYECPYGLSQEKEETLFLKEKLFLLIKQNQLTQARDYFKAYTKDRPDVLLETADLSGELRLLYQIITAALAEEAEGFHTLTDSHCEDYNRLLLHYKRLLTILEHAAQGELTIEDKAYIEETGPSFCVLKAIAGFSPSLSNLDLKQILAKE